MVYCCVHAHYIRTDGASTVSHDDLYGMDRKLDLLMHHALCTPTPAHTSHQISEFFDEYSHVDTVPNLTHIHTYTRTQTHDHSTHDEIPSDAITHSNTQPDTRAPPLPKRVHFQPWVTVVYTDEEEQGTGNDHTTPAPQEALNTTPHRTTPHRPGSPHPNAQPLHAHTHTGTEPHDPTPPAHDEPARAHTHRHTHADSSVDELLSALEHDILDEVEEGLSAGVLALNASLLAVRLR